MKKNILKSLFVGLSLLAFASCDLNSWNNDLDGFIGDPAAKDVKTIEYTLTDADYANLAANTTNIALAGDNIAKLKAVGTSHCFNSVITARDYVPAFFSDPDFAYFALSNGSAIKLTYNVAVNQPAAATAIEGATQYEVTESDYQTVWGSDEDFINSFAPSKPASKNLTKILTKAFPAATSGSYVIVNYNTSAQEPVFTKVEPEPVPTFPMTSVLGTIAVGTQYDVAGIVTGICNQGYILTDNSGSVLVYYGKSFVAANYAIGDQIKLKATAGSYNLGLQLTGTGATEEKVGTQAVTYPAPTIYDGATFDALLTRTTDQLAIYSQITADVTVSGNYYNFNVAGAATAVGSLYQGTDAQKALFGTGGKFIIKGYMVSVSKSSGVAKFPNFIVTDAKAVTTTAMAKSAVVDVPTTNENAVYYFDGTSWKQNSSVTILNPADYTAMGQSYGNLTTPDVYLPTYLKVKFPYAQAKTTKLVVYKYFANSKTTYKCDEYTFDGTNWIKNNGVAQETAQFVMNGGKWMYDPNVTITLPAGKGQDLSTKYYQACVDWVYENIDKPLGSTGIKDGKFYVSSYGNNEYYSGTSAYQGNVDLRAASAKTQYLAGYTSMTDDEIVAKMKQRFESEVLPGALAKLHPDAAPVPGLEVIYTVNFSAYTGSTAVYTARYKVVSQGKFEFIDCTWNTAK